MPNTGKPSRDCHLCRKRRVKVSECEDHCDLARPHCRRCTKYGATCPGYREQQDLVFRNADPTTIERQRGRTKLTAPTMTRDDEGNSGGGKMQITLGRPLVEHWTAQSVPILLNVYDLDFIRDMYREHGAGGPLMWAAHLFSRTYVLNMRNPTAVCGDSESEARRELGKYLGKTLRMVSQALTTTEGCHRDDVLATVWVLASYELLLGTLNHLESDGSWHLHTRGLYSILQTRGAKILYSDRGRTAFWPAFSMIQIQCIVTGSRSPPESDEWLDIIESTLYPGEGTALHISRFVAAVSAIQSRILDIFDQLDFSAASREFRTLFNKLTQARQHVRTHLDTHMEHHALDPYLCNLQRAASLKGHHMMQLLTNFLTHDPGSAIPAGELAVAREACLREVRAASEEILESIPRALQPLERDARDKSPRALFDALKIIWPLTAIFLAPSARGEHRVRAERILLYIGSELGVRHALGVRRALNSHPGRRLLPPEALGTALDALPEVGVWTNGGMSLE